MVIDGILGKTNTVIGGVVSPTLILISSIILIIGVTTALFMINAKVALIASIGFAIIYLAVIRYTNQQLKENSQLIAVESTTMIKSLQEGLGGIRDVLISGAQNFYSELYVKLNLTWVIACGNNQFIAGSPRFVVEAIGMSLIAVLAYSMTQQESGLVKAIPNILDAISASFSNVS